MTPDQSTTPNRSAAGAVRRAEVSARPHATRRGFVSRAVCISIALTFMTVSLLGAASAIGFWPDPLEGTIQERTGLLEMIAISATEAVTRGDERALEPLARDLARGSSRIRSISVRRENGSTIYESAGHAGKWAGAPAEGSTLTHARLRIFNGDQRWGVIELTFDEPEASRILGIAVHPQIRGLLLTSLVAFVAYWICAHLMLRRLQPAGAVPERIQRVFDAMTEAVVLLDHAERIVVANEAFWILTKQAPGDLLGKTPSCLRWASATPGADPIALPWIETLKDGATRTRQRLVLVGDDGSTRILNAAAAAIAGPNGKPLGALLTLDDVSIIEEQIAENTALLAQVARTGEELRLMNEELEILASTDQLTECFNRRALLDHFQRLSEQSARSREPLGCIMVDIDHFKLVNDKHGHAAGDSVLKDIGQRLREVVGSSGIVGRSGGEEFCIAVTKSDLQATLALAERIRRAIEAAPCSGLAVTASLGIAATGAQMISPESLIASADDGLYAAKRAGRNRVAAANRPDIAKAA